METKETPLKITRGLIQESYHFTMDGEYCSGYKEYNVEVTEWWKTGALKNIPKEVKTSKNKFFRHTKQNGWREYYKESKSFKVNRYTGTSVGFTPNITTDNSNDYNKVNLGNW